MGMSHSARNSDSNSGWGVGRRARLETREFGKGRDPLPVDQLDEVEADWLYL